MNRERRKEIDAVIEALTKMQEIVGELTSQIENIRDDEQEAFDNLPEGPQDSERGERIYEAVSKLDEAISSMEMIDIDDVTSILEDAKD